MGPATSAASKSGGREQRAGSRERGGASRSGERGAMPGTARSEEHTSELQSHLNLVCRLLLEKKNFEHLVGRDAAAAEEDDRIVRRIQAAVGDRIYPHRLPRPDAHHRSLVGGELDPHDVLACL